MYINVYYLDGMFSVNEAFLYVVFHEYILQCIGTSGVYLSECLFSCNKN